MRATSSLGPGRRSIAVLGCVLLVLFAVTACTKGQANAGGKATGTSSSTSAASPSGTTSPAAANTSGAAAGAGVAVYDVYVKNFQYHGMPKVVPANQPLLVSFTNRESFSIQHELVVLRLPKGKTAQDVVADAKKKATCWQNGKAGGGTGPAHVAIGMIAPFTAKAGASAPTTTQTASYDVDVKNFQYHGMPATVPANQPIMVSFTNQESFSIQHEFVVLQVPKGKTAQDVVADAKKKGPDAEDDWIHYADSGDPLDTGAGTLVTMDLPPGNYVATCWQNGKAGGGTGPAHVAIGMIAPFTAR
jgi:hypothetical protein